MAFRCREHVQTDMACYSRVMLEEVALAMAEREKGNAMGPWRLLRDSKGGKPQSSG